MPTVDPLTVVPPAGRVGDLYVSYVKKVVSMYLCFAAGDGVSTAAKWAQFQTSGSFTAF